VIIRRSSLDNPRPRKVPGAWLIAGSITALCLGIALTGDAGRLALRYERSGLAHGEWWRLLSAHLVHLSWSHTALNIVALLLLAAIFGPVVRAVDWLVVVIAAALTIDAGLYFTAPQIDWYVGLSGVLHGLFAAGALALAPTRPAFALALALGLAIKLTAEILGGPLHATAALTGGDVVTQAHLFGAIAGLAAQGIRLALAAPRRGSV
jgi:rhomboid family GlyGly-CTERM serine protease